MADYREAPLSSRPQTLEPSYYGLNPEQKQAAEERLALRANLKRQYQLQLNDPHRKTLIDDPALNRWMFARNRNIYPNFRATPKTSLMGLFWGIGPLFFWYYVFKTDRDRKEKLIQEGKLERPFQLSY
ncbi:NADH dehydrogenase [ubiquinone] 1 beta subcomplex subunit 4 [Spea bombifrons]|uniref:NADH dehydrogenase [ubiquinone] 1 beta subcomplex subunit 4 n=1 Tax=Spea bombifrons TaxID=233779 RepID=UPI00234AB48A|nr:NADH dehydrogenase [ubiquinone] 1 beta subcomplex subunit 4 [Spea bombifrons]